MAITKEDKEQALLDHFQAHLGMSTPRSKQLAWVNIGIQHHDLPELDAPFQVDEIKAAVFSLSSIKAPGPDGFIGAFFKSCWEIIREDVMAAISQLANLRGDCAGLINLANIILLPKKESASWIGDYRPISLIHNISKIFSKLLANRLAPRLPSLVSKCRSAFVQKRCIHDNFLHVQNLVKELHRSSTPGFFLKLDISKVFDSVGWAYLLEVLQQLGFGQRWRDWICMILASSSSRVLLNGDSGPPFAHACGLRQGDPLSPCCSFSPSTLFS